jgi:hypothetical protein
MKQVNGSIEIESSPGMGATIILNLPIAERGAIEAGSGGRVSAATVSIRDGRVSSYLAAVLRAQGIVVSEAEEPDEGSELWVTDHREGVEECARAFVENSPRRTVLVVAPAGFSLIHDRIVVVPSSGGFSELRRNVRAALERGGCEPRPSGYQDP